MKPPTCQCDPTEMDGRNTFIDDDGVERCEKCYMPLKVKRSYGSLIVLAVIAALGLGYFGVPYMVPMAKKPPVKSGGWTLSQTDCSANPSPCHAVPDFTLDKVVCSFVANGKTLATWQARKNDHCYSADRPTIYLKSTEHVNAEIVMTPPP